MERRTGKRRYTSSVVSTRLRGTFVDQRLAQHPRDTRRTYAGVAIDVIETQALILTRFTAALVDFRLAEAARKARRTLASKRIDSIRAIALVETGDAAA